MKRAIGLCTIAALVALAATTCKTKEPPEPGEKTPAPARIKGTPVVVITTNMGRIEVELDPKGAPIATQNFLQYVNDEFYDGTIFHRVMSKFVIQGGGFTKDLRKKQTLRPAINLEINKGLGHVRGTIAMARIPGQPDSATTQFFINVEDNTKGLGPSARDPGYAVFGKVVSGMDVVDKIRAVKTHTVVPPGGGRAMSHVPVKPVVIESIRVKG